MTSPTLYPSTTQEPLPESALASPPRLALTIAAHPVRAKIGLRAFMTNASDRSPFKLSRVTPLFHTAHGDPVGPIDEPHTSRDPVVLAPHPDGSVRLAPPTKAAFIARVNGAPLVAPIVYDANALRRGVIIDLSARVVVLLHTHAGTDEVLPDYGLVGASAAIHRVRLDIKRAATLQVPVLIRGASGTGKELIARAIHAASPRASRAYVALNIAALNPMTAAAELFGHSRGSFTGAFDAREGHFREAEGGTIFLDEIGEAPRAIQVMLLRTLESGEIQPVGDRAGRRVDVRLVTATDADLERAVISGDFRISLLHRLAGFELHVPPLRWRRDDIPRLLVHFIEQELKNERATALLDDPRSLVGSWSSARFIVDLLCHDWPGNVRELANVVRRLVGELLHGRPVPSLSTLVGGAAEWLALERSPTELRRERTALAVKALSDEALFEAMQRHKWQINATARELGISRKALYARIEKSEQLHKARDLSRAEVSREVERHEGDLGKAADALKVSVRALKLRLRALEDKK